VRAGLVAAAVTGLVVLGIGFLSLI
jgi:hypothetical protein